MINISAEDTKLFEQNGFTKEKVQATVQHYREQGLSDDVIQEKMNNRISEFKGNAEPELKKQGGIDLTPSGLLEQAGNIGASTVLTPVEMIKSKTINPIEAYKNAYQTNEQNMALAKKASPLLSGASNLGVDLLGYSRLPMLQGGGFGNFVGNALIQGGIPGTLESLKRGGNAEEGVGIGTAIAMGLNGISKGMPIVGQGIQKLINNENFKSGVSNALEGLTSVPADYSQRALDAELAGNSLFKGKFDANTAYRPIEQKLKQAKSMLPTSENYADEFYKLGQKVKSGMDSIKQSAGQEINEMLGKLNAEPIQINGLKNSLNSLVKNYAMGGNINPAEIRAGRDIELVKDLLKIKNDEQLTKDLGDYFVNNRLSKPAQKALTEEEKEMQEVAFNILEHATGKSKQWLKSQLNANLPKMATQKRQEFIKNLLDSTDDKISVKDIDPTWYNYFPDLLKVDEQYGVKGEEIAEKALRKILDKDFKNNANVYENRFDSMLNDLDSQYDKILYNLTKNPVKNGFDNALSEFNKVFGGVDENIKSQYVEKFANDLDNITNIANPKIKPIDLHNAKEILYDMANYDTAGGMRNDVLKGMANQINNYLRTKFPQYKNPNDKFSVIKKLEYNLGGSNGINANTIGGKLSNYGSSANIVSGLDNRLRDLDMILPQQNRFIKDAKTLVDSRNEVNNTLNTINKQYERNPKLLANRTDEGFELALEDLQDSTGVKFMDELNNLRAREALEKFFPGQGGGSGSSQGFGNLFRTAIIGGTPTAAAITGNPTALLGLAAISPKIMAKGTIQNLGRLYRNLGQQVPDSVQRLLNPLAVRMTTPMLYGGISNTSDY